jgi:hypothetical protein
MQVAECIGVQSRYCMLLPWVACFRGPLRPNLRVEWSEGRESVAHCMQ